MPTLPPLPGALRLGGSGWTPVSMPCHSRGPDETASPTPARAARPNIVKAEPTLLLPLSTRREIRLASGRSWLVAAGLFVAVAVLGAAGCGHKIGDACTNSADCDPSGGNRTCDLSEPGGYCIIEGCDARSCPSDSVCVRFFPEQPLLDPTKACDPAAVCTAPASGVCCDPGEECLSDAKNPGQAACARLSLEKRACVQGCNENGDCRSGYVCRSVGTCGTLALTLDPKAVPKFCAPVPSADNGSLALCPR